MPPRIICPHCHSPIDPLTLEVAVSAQAQYRICPECDEPIVWSVGCDGEGAERSVVSDSSNPIPDEELADRERVAA